MEGIMDNLTGLNAWSVVFRIIMSVIFGGFIGWERGYHGRAAGLRTHILVCVGATMTTLIGQYSMQVLHYNGDPLRMGAQVVSGIGFLGAGTIMIRNRTRVTGLTTAAGLWATASIGLALGIGFYLAAILAFFSVIISVTALSYFERYTKQKDTYAGYVELKDDSVLKDFYNEISPYIYAIDIVPAKSGIAGHVGLEFFVDKCYKYHEIFEKTQENGNVLITVPIRK